MEPKKNFQKPDFVKKFFNRLTSKPRVGGFSITNGGLQYVFSETKEPKAFALKLPLDVMKDGRLQKPDEFIAVAKKLYEMIDVERKRDPIQIIVTLPAFSVYTQSFSVPNIDREKLEESAILNLQMLSPVPKEQAYMSYQVIHESTDKYDLLGAFIEKKVVDDFQAALIAANFFPIAFEFPSLALSRLLTRNIQTPTNKSSLVLYVSSDGIDFFIVRGESLLFDYFRSWQSIQGVETNIQKDLFITTIMTETQKVSNFVMSRYKERVDAIYLATPAFAEEIQSALKTAVGISAIPLAISGIQLSPSWYVAYGSSLRDFQNSDADSINLNFESADDIFFEQHALSFLFFWRRIAVVSGVLFLGVFLVAFSFLNEQLSSLQQQFDASRAQVNAKELSVLKAQADQFNGIVAELKQEPRKLKEWEVFFGTISRVAKNNNTTIERLAVTSFSSPIVMSAKAPDNKTTLAFKNALSKTPGFSQVEAPLLSIKELEDGSVGFIVNFSVDIKTLLAPK